ncbi:hypothetical protein AB0F81_27215 [Actinoplanes sp. NPDC024001]|uniref:hypothetical protein n=1 Tax=Actinoplanes sp. NPDC024001 TaxID=3154598 RepID=UPI0033FC088E
MSTQEHVYLYSPRKPAELAGELASTIKMRIVDGERGETFLSRPLPDGSGDVGGELHRNDLADPDSFAGAFALVLDVGVTGGDRDQQIAEARKLFTDLSESNLVAAALVRGHDFLIGFTSPSTGLIWLPEGITPYAEDRDVWLPLTAHLA